MLASSSLADLHRAANSQLMGAVQEELEAKQAMEEFNANREDGQILHGYRTPEEDEVRDWAISSSAEPPLRPTLSGASSEQGSQQHLLSTLEVESDKS